jgi:peptidoglycan/xylan/chitin deacetylase (PgdA/CDA1 family)
VVLYYHSIGEAERRRFAGQMDELLKRARPFPAGWPEQMETGAHNVAVTFDDGFRSVVENAVPELTKRGIPFTVFVPSGCLGERPTWVRDRGHRFFRERVLSAGELRGIAATPLATLGSHSVTHSNLTRLEASRAVEELRRSKSDLEAAAGVKVEFFSFPHGAYTSELAQEARRAGYRRVFTIEPVTIGANAEIVTVGRVAVDPADWPLEFRLKMAGAYRWRACYHRLKRS